MTQLSYRRDIDGLRALAIIPVVWFHSGLPGLPGGFTGVDTFFVISGYLISAILNRELDDGTFSFSGFYQRRVRRIAPALLVVLLATLGAGAVLLLPYEFVSLCQSAIASIAMVANVFFWRVAGYFMLGEGVTPLLHMWSLGVEEQFYLFFPSVLLMSSRFRANTLVVLAIAVASFALCVAAVERAPSAAFYLLPTRAWELMLGALLAVAGNPVPARLRQHSAGLGLVLLTAAALLITKSDPYPGYRALLPTLGATLLIAAGPGTAVNRAISARPLVGLGKISYSLYLWHWPVFAYMRHFRADPVLPVGWAIAGIALSVVLSILTFRLVEQPARRRSVPFSTVGYACLGTGAAVVVGAIATVAAHGLPGRFSPSVLALSDRRNDLARLAHACVNTPLSKLEECHVGPAGRPTLVVWGDSHAAATGEAVALGLGAPGLVASFNSCVPALRWTSPNLVGRDPAACRARNAALLRSIRSAPTVTTVVLAAYWPAHARTGGLAMWSGVAEVARQLRSAGKRVILLAGTPEPPADMPWASAIRARFDRPPIRLDCPRPAIPVRGVVIVDLSAAFCRDPHPEQLFTDGNHPSRTAGVRIITPAMRAAR